MASKTNLSESQSSKYWDSYPPKLTVNPSDYLVDKKIVLSKNISVLNFHEIISLVFHAIENIKDRSECTEWNNLHKDFIELLDSENKRRWPKLNYMTNTYRKRLEVFFSSTFTSTNNVLLLLIRLLYIESFKNDNGTLQIECHQPLQHHIAIPDKYMSTEVSIVRLFELLKMYLNYYIKIYHNEMMFEHLLGKAIINQI